uniref:Uncharacterized protein n=1 Tax=Arundo donax TaxID=35708 RepID=A0A0A9G4Q2_ARUDO
MKLQHHILVSCRTSSTSVFCHFLFNIQICSSWDFLFHRKLCIRGHDILPPPSF